jgi:hypothetical protein
MNLELVEGRDERRQYLPLNICSYFLSNFHSSFVKMFYMLNISLSCLVREEAPQLQLPLPEQGLYLQRNQLQIDKSYPNESFFFREFKTQL